MRKSYLGKRGASVLHYSVSNDSLATIVWLDYSRTEELGNDLSSQFRTALTYADVATHDLAVEPNGKLWRVVDQEVMTPAAVTTLRNLRLQEITQGAQTVGGDAGNILLEDFCDVLLQDDCQILLEGGLGLRIVAANEGAIAAGDTINANPVDASSNRTNRYSITSVVESTAIGEFNVYRLGASAA